AVDAAHAENDDRAGLAETRLATMDARVPRLTVRLASKADGVRVRRDDTELGLGSFGTTLPVEPGEHVVTVIAPHHEDRTFRVKLSEGERQTMEVDVGRTLESDSSTSSVAKDQGAPSSGMRTIGWITGGVGLAAVAAGSVFGV